MLGCFKAVFCGFLSLFCLLYILLFLLKLGFQLIYTLLLRRNCRIIGV